MDDTAARCAGPGCGRPWPGPPPACPPGTAATTAARPPAAPKSGPPRKPPPGPPGSPRPGPPQAGRRPLEAAGFRDVGEHAALVASCAADPGRPRRELDQALAGLHQAVAHLAGLARQYRDAADTARELTDVS